MANKILSGIFILIFFVGAFALFGQNTNIEDELRRLEYRFYVWNRSNGYRELTRSEFGDGIFQDGIFNSLDLDDNYGIEMDELRPVINVLFPVWDKDKNGNLSPEEFLAQGIWLEDDYNMWDGDKDHMLTVEEFETGVFETWNNDTDNSLQFNEFVNGLFVQLDMDKNGKISEYEVRSGIE